MLRLDMLRHNYKNCNTAASYVVTMMSSFNKAMQKHWAHKCPRPMSHCMTQIGIERVSCCSMDHVVSLSTTNTLRWCHKNLIREHHMENWPSCFFSASLHGISWHRSDPRAAEQRQKKKQCSSAYTSIEGHRSERVQTQHLLNRRGRKCMAKP